MATKSATKKKTRRIRSPHPGVVIEVPTGSRLAYRLRYRDPETGRIKKERLDPTALRTAEARRDYAIRKAKQLARRRLELAEGAPVLNRTPLGVAIKAYLEERASELRESTLELYQAAIARFAEWTEANGIETTADITGARLAAFRDHLAGQRKQAIAKKGKRGQRKQTRAKLSPATINWQLRAVKSMLNHWRLRGLVVQIDRDTITDSLAALSVPKEQTDFLAPGECRRLLEAALAHDQASFQETRDEHAREGRNRIGTTPRYEPIAPLVALLLLTGMRFSEGLGLRWADVDLDAVDAEGKPVGEIRLRATGTKTKHGRTIGLEVAPSLRALLCELDEGRAGAFVFGGADPLSRSWAEAARKRLQASSKAETRKRGDAPHGFDAPKFSWQLLRRTCGTYLVNAPAIYGAASIYMAARQLGHSVQVAERHYLGVHRGVSREARTLEEAMQIAEVMGRVVEAAAAGSKS